MLVTGSQLHFGGVIDEADKAVLTGEFADYMVAGLRARVRTASPTGTAMSWLSWASGASRWMIRRCRRSLSGKATRTGWCPTRTANG